MKGLPVPGAEGTYLHNRQCPLHKQVFFTKGGIYGLLLVSAGARWLLAQTCPCAKELEWQMLVLLKSSEALWLLLHLFCLSFLEALPHCPVNASGLWLD